MERQELEILIKQVTSETEKILLEEIRSLVLRSAPMMASINGEQACHLIVSSLAKWASASPSVTTTN